MRNTISVAFGLAAAGCLTLAATACSDLAGDCENRGDCQPYDGGMDSGGASGQGGAGGTSGQGGIFKDTKG